MYQHKLIFSLNKESLIAKDYIICDFIYMKYKTGQHQSILMKAKWWVGAVTGRKGTCLFL